MTLYLIKHPNHILQFNLPILYDGCWQSIIKDNLEKIDKEKIGNIFKINITPQECPALQIRGSIDYN